MTLRLQPRQVLSLRLADIEPTHGDWNLHATTHLEVRAAAYTSGSDWLARTDLQVRATSSAHLPGVIFPSGIGRDGFISLCCLGIVCAWPRLPSSSRSPEGGFPATVTGKTGHTSALSPAVEPRARFPAPRRRHYLNPGATPPRATGGSDTEDFPPTRRSGPKLPASCDAMT